MSKELFHSKKTVLLSINETHKKKNGHIFTCNNNVCAFCASMTKGQMVKTYSSFKEYNRILIGPRILIRTKEMQANDSWIDIIKPQESPGKQHEYISSIKSIEGEKRKE